MERFGIDVSRYQNKMDFGEAAVRDDVSFVIMKAGGGDDGLYKDRCFERHYEACCDIGMDKGAYFFGHAMNTAQAQKEAAYFMTLLEGKKFEYPVFYDVEAEMLSAQGLTDIILAFLYTLRDEGCKRAGVYASESPMNELMDIRRIADEGFYVWCARYSTRPPQLKDDVIVDIWQFGGGENPLRSNQVAGCVCDQNYCYTDFSRSESEPMSQETAENYVRSCYVQYLDRDADTGGLKNFSEQLRDGWASLQVDEAIRNSEECHRLYVRKCYRIFLGREASEEEVGVWAHLAMHEICNGIYESEEARIRRSSIEL